MPSENIHTGLPQKQNSPSSSKGMINLTITTESQEVELLRGDLPEGHSARCGGDPWEVFERRVFDISYRLDFESLLDYKLGESITYENMEFVVCDKSTSQRGFNKFTAESYI